MDNTHVSLPSAVDQFCEAMVQKGIVPPDAVERDGKMHRFSSSGKAGDDAGWYVYHDGAVPSGAFGDFRTGQKSRSWVADVGRALSPEEAAVVQKQQSDIKAKRNADKADRRAKAKDKASAMLRHSRPSGDDHPYLERKGVKAHRIASWKDLLLVPMIDDTQKVQSLQLISGDGSKKFLSGGKMQGCYFPIGNIKKADTILIAEGYATAATVYETTELPVIVAFNAENLVHVAKSIRAQHPDAEIIICADDDHKTKGNPGLTKATEAAKAVNGKVIAPKFSKNRPDSATDFNDMAAHMGKDAVSGLFLSFFLGRYRDAAPTTETASDNAKDADEDDEEQLVVSNPAAPANKTVPVPPTTAYEQPLSHFADDEFLKVHKIWKSVPRKATRHDENGYHLLLNNRHKIVVTKDRVEMGKGILHRPPDEAYVAACEQARQLWDGQMEVHGDNKHRVKAFAYASVYGVQVTNFTPNERELIEAEKIMNSVRAAMPPSFGRPTIRKPQQSPRPKI